MKAVLALVVLFSTNFALAMSEDEFSECIIEDHNNEQAVVGLLQELIYEKGDASTQEQLIAGVQAEVQKPEVVTCADLEATLGKIYLAGILEKQKNTPKKSNALTSEQFTDCVMTNESNAQVVYGLVQSALEQQLIDGAALLPKLVGNSDTTSCLDVNAVLTQAYVDGLDKRQTLSNTEAQ